MIHNSSGSFVDLQQGVVVGELLLKVRYFTDYATTPRAPTLQSQQQFNAILQLILQQCGDTSSRSVNEWSFLPPPHDPPRAFESDAEGSGSVAFYDPSDEVIRFMAFGFAEAVDEDQQLLRERDAALQRWHDLMFLQWEDDEIYLYDVWETHEMEMEDHAAFNGDADAGYDQHEFMVAMYGANYANPPAVDGDFDDEAYVLEANALNDMIEQHLAALAAVDDDVDDEPGPAELANIAPRALRMRGGGPQGKRRAGAMVAPEGTRQSPRLGELSVLQNYPGFRQIPFSEAFGTGSADVLVRLRRTVLQSRVELHEGAANQLQQRQAGTDVPWSRQKGSPNEADQLTHREVTIPAVGISPRAAAILSKRARGSVALTPLSRGVRHFASIQNDSGILAAGILQRLRDLGGSGDDLYHIATQISDSVPGSCRTKHLDPQLIAAALATFSMEGTAEISLHSKAGLPTHSFQCNGQSVYVLTGRAASHDMHAVLVQQTRRVSVTLRFASRRRSEGLLPCETD
jgi:hypothetical protein